MANIETYNEITLDMLTENTVSVLTRTYADVNGIKTQIGSNTRKAYGNSAYGRNMLASEVPEPFLSTVLTLWGPEPTLMDPPMPAAPEVPSTETDDTEPAETESGESVEVVDDTEPTEVIEDEAIEEEEIPETVTESIEDDTAVEPGTEATASTEGE